MRVGIMCLQNAPFATLAARARLVEAMGADSLWTADHFVDPYAPDRPWLEAWTLLGALARETSRVTLGPLVSSLTLRNPAVLARAAATLDDLSTGRAECSIGAGGAPLDHAMTGTEPWDSSARHERFAAAVATLEQLLERGYLDPDDPANGAAAGPRASGTIVEPHGWKGRRIRLTVAALGPRAIDVAARHADAWNSYGVSSGRDVRGLLAWDDAMALLARRSERLDAACSTIGRTPDSVTRSYTLVETYRTPLSVSAAEARFATLRGLGVSEVIVYWPPEPAAEAFLPRLVELAHAT